MPSLDFKGKQYVYSHHLSVPFRELKIDAGKSLPKDGEPSLNDNLIIHGDNLHALKALLPRYAGKVDCIYIDPPYNTGNEGWCYNDKVNSPLMKTWLEKSANPVDSEDLERHDKWLCMMWPRLQLLRELLAHDGLIFVSIDEIENTRLVELMKEIFGEDHYLGQFIWKSRQNKDNRNKSGMSIDHEYIVVFGREIAGEERLDTNYSNEDNDERGAWTSGNMVGLASKEDRPNLHYNLIRSETDIDYGCPERGWRYNKKRMQTLIKENRILWPASPMGRPREKVFLAEMGSHTNISSVINRPIFTRNGTDSVERILGHREFPFPKPPELIQFMIEQHPNKDAVILDSFAGSGTTAQAVMTLNESDGGKRKYILVECEDYADKITAERVRRVANGYEFSGTERAELLSKNITWSMFQKKQLDILNEIEELESSHANRFDSIKKSIKGGLLTVVGQKKITERIDGLGGSFTFCELGEAFDIEKILAGENLPDYNSLAQYVFYTATGESLNHSVKKQDDHFVGETEWFEIYLIYKDDLAYLRSNESALNQDKLDTIAKRESTKQKVVFATAKYMSQLELTDHKITFCQIPYAIHKIAGN